MAATRPVCSHARIRPDIAGDRSDPGPV